VASGASKFLYLANLLCLDLVNTRPMQQGEQVELLQGFADLIAWLRDREVIPGAAARQALERWDGTAEGAAVFRHALLLRETLREAAQRLVDGKPVGRELVAVVNRLLASRPVYSQLIRQGRGYVTRLETESDAALHLLVPVAESAAWLLEHGDPSLVKRCEDPRCVLFFYDTTKNQSRRWCSMDTCGSRAKAMAYYQRQRTGKS
jgi:predicted RNA-binding Zn ribbon-like protein